MPTRQHNSKGFTLVELMITIVILGLLMAISVPMFIDQIRKGRRFDATSTLLSMEQSQELYRTNHTYYGTKSQVWGTVNGSWQTPDEHYSLDITFPTSNTSGYLLTATAKGEQANDTGCEKILVTVTNLTTTRTPEDCW